MLESKTFQELITASAKTLRDRFLANLSSPVSFSNLSTLPHERGVYFIVCNDQKDQPIYIGSASAAGRTLKIRCGQYLQKGSGGYSVRGRLGKLLNLNDEETINYLKEKLSIRYIVMASGSKDQILQLEQAAIWACQPVLNYVLDKFKYGDLTGHIPNYRLQPTLMLPRLCLKDSNINFYDYKLNVIKHELGHWISAKHLGFNVGDITVTIRSNEVGFGHDGASAIYPNPEVNDCESLYQYLEKRICVLYSGIISQLLSNQYIDDKTRNEAFSTDGEDDNRKIRELLFIARGVRFAGSIQKDNELEQTNLIIQECWEKACSLIEEHKNSILFVSQKMNEKLKVPNKTYRFTEDELDNWLLERTA